MNRFFQWVLTPAIILTGLAGGPTPADPNGFHTSGKPQLGYDLAPNGAEFPLPDLVVTQFQALGSPKMREEGYISLPVKFQVANQGVRPAGSFKVSVHYYLNEPGAQMRLVKFTSATPGQKPSWFAWNGPLDVGESSMQRGTLSLPRKLAGKMVTLRLWADSTASEEFARKTGRVAESSEKNNWSEPRIRLRLPKLRPQANLLLSPGK